MIVAKKDRGSLGRERSRATALKLTLKPRLRAESQLRADLRRVSWQRELPEAWSP